MAALSPWSIAYLAVAAAALSVSLVLLLQVWEHRRYGRSCMLAMGKHHPRGHVAVFAPCKGIDVALADNLRALMRQDHADYEVRFVVESDDDPACEVIRRVMAEHPGVPARLVVAGCATDCGQKVHNLREATADLSGEIDYLAFIDSDARPRPEWLRLLIRRLDRPALGAVTGYRWFVPERPTLANHLLYSVNCDVMSLLGQESHYMIWGGSWGIRRELFASLGVRDAWRRALTDDLSVTQLLRRAGLPVRFEPACVVASPLDYTFGELFSFARRQYFLGRCYVRDWWTLGLAGTSLAAAAWLGGLAATALGLAAGDPIGWIAPLALAALYLVSALRGGLRQNLIGTYFADLRPALRRGRRVDIWLSPLVGLVNWLGMLGSAFGRHVTWRGIRYRVASGGQIESVDRERQPVILPLHASPAPPPAPADSDPPRQAETG